MCLRSKVFLSSRMQKNIIYLLVLFLFRIVDTYNLFVIVKKMNVAASMRDYLTVGPLNMTLNDSWSLLTCLKILGRRGGMNCTVYGFAC